jgi:hypothetical protein
MSVKTILNLEGIELECYFDHTPAEPANGIAERLDLLGALISDVDIYPLLSFDQITELEQKCATN